MGVLRKMFGPSRKEIWQQLSTQIGARYIDGGVWKGDKVEAKHGQWTVTLDTYAVSTGKATIVYDLFAETLDQLCRIGSAYETDPDVTV